MNNSFAAESWLDAKQRLIKAGLEIFGTFNLEGATTRQLAERAGVNQAAIPYYFGGKEGLYLAVIEHLITHKASRVRPVLLQISELLQQKRLTTEEAVNQIKTLFGVYLQVLLDDKQLARRSRFRRPSSTTGFVFAAADPAGSLILKDVANQGADLTNISVVDGN
jgi:AcrR family transcriptional regulator